MAKSSSERNNEKQARIVRLQAALKIARDGLKKLQEGDYHQAEHFAACVLDEVDERMMKR